jgi:hypothetical protein
VEKLAAFNLRGQAGESSDNIRSTAAGIRFVATTRTSIESKTRKGIG